MRIRQGFTLLELLIVIIIVGVLAAVAVPMFFNQIENARSTEARNTIGTIRRAMEACYMGTQDYAACFSWDAMGMSDPGLASGAHFTYQVYSSGAGGCIYTIEATRNALDSGEAGRQVDLIFFNNTYAWCSDYGTNQNCGAAASCMH